MTQPDRLIGGRYRIVRKIAEGGMGAVYEAQHNLSKKAVALKILFEHIGRDENARQRFLREVSAPAQIGHDGIVEVYDACLLYTSPSPRDKRQSRMPSSA